jgi:uncharacterized protein YigA (DUF484 family)
VSKPRKAVTAPESRLADERVAAYLRRHPDFLVRHTELLGRLAAPSQSRGDGVIDMQIFLIERLQAEVRTLKQQCETLVAGGRDYLACQNRVHAAVNLLIDATGLDHLVQLVTIDWLSILDIDVSVLGVENAEKNGPAYAGVRCLEPKMVEGLIGLGRVCVTGECRPAVLPLFGAAATLVRSHALLRLDLGDQLPNSLLALGSRREDRFPEGQGGEVLSFLARFLGYCLRARLTASCPH